MMNLYPKIRNVKKSHLLIDGLVIGSIIMELILILINYLVNDKIHWSLLCGVGIVYIWITAIYAIYKNINIASHVFLQMICTSIIVVVVDWMIGFKGWSLHIGIPIITMIANVTMFVLTIVARKRYGKYIVFHTLIFLFSFIPLCFPEAIHRLFIIISVSIAVISFVITTILCGRDMVAETKRRLHW